MRINNSVDLNVKLGKKRLDSPLCANGFSLPVWHNKLGMVHCKYCGIIGYNFQRISFSEDCFLTEQNV